MVTTLADNPIGRRVRMLREQMRMTQEELARLAGVPRGWLGPLELGEIANPGAERTDQLARALGTTSRYLISGQRPDESPDASDPELEIAFRQFKGEMSDRDRELLLDFLTWQRERRRRYQAEHPDEPAGQ